MLHERLDWLALPQETAREAFAQLVGAPLESPTFQVSGVAAALPFYRHWQLLRLSSVHCESNATMEDVFALWRHDRAPVLLDGDAEPVHAANRDESLQLDHARAADYIRWFCFAVRADEQPFILFEKSPVIPADAPVLDRFAASEAQPLDSHGIGADGHDWFSANLLFAGSSHIVVFSVASDGRIVMVGDRVMPDAFPPTLIPEVPRLGIGPRLRSHLAIAQPAVESSSGARPGVEGAPLGATFAAMADPDRAGPRRRHWDERSALLARQFAASQEKEDSRDLPD